jgi:hypothetical protein
MNECKLTIGLLPESQCLHEILRYTIPSDDWDPQESHVNDVKLLLGIDVSDPAQVSFTNRPECYRRSPPSHPLPHIVQEVVGS